MKLSKTNRGFNKIKFEDRYKEECSIQDSSLATEAAIWFGVDNPSLMMMASHGQENGTGWIKIPLHENVTIMPTRMHLTQSQVKELLPILQRFAETGTIGDVDED